jgi:hypothetical protein
MEYQPNEALNFDPNEQVGNLPAGHYALRANEYDGLLGDPVKQAQGESCEMALALISLPPEARTAEMIAEMRRRSLRAGRLAIAANEKLV